MTAPLKFKAEMFWAKGFGSIVQLVSGNSKVVECNEAAIIAQREFDKWMKGLPVVYSGWHETDRGSSCTDMWHTTYWPHNVPTHSARIFDIQPIERDTAESLLRELLGDREGGRPGLTHDWLDRVRKLLDGGE